MAAIALVGVIMGSRSDLETMRHAVEILEKFGVPHEKYIVSAHRTPQWMAEYANTAESRGLEVIIAGAGGAAHLPGMVAGNTLLPVLGVPVESHSLKGMDSLLSIVQMPGGIPVGTLAIGKAGAINAGLLAVAILANSRPDLREKLRVFREEQTARVRQDSLELKPILPGAAIGVLGSGQLGRMFAIAARRMGYRVHTLSPERDTPTGQVADVEIDAPYDDLGAVASFARHVRAVTFEFENVPAPAAETCARYGPVRPAGHVLHTTQHRIREKCFLEGAGLPLTPFRTVNSLDDLRAAADELGIPAILKTADFGYDGKGQVHIASADQLESAWAAMNGAPAVLEAFVDFERELSVIAARSEDGAFVHYGAVENHHEHRILDITIAPARVSESVQRDAVDIARCVLEKLDVVGVLCVEFFLTRKGQLLINELAPRPHNSGHFTFDACVTSQFEQQLEAVCNLPLGSPAQMRPAVMVNLLGDLWAAGEPDWTAACRHPGVKLHLYGKMQPRPGRKMGHLTALAEDVEAALATALAARSALTSGRG